MDDNLGAASVSRRARRELSPAVRHQRQPSLSPALWLRTDFFGDHKGRIEADAELPDQAHILRESPDSWLMKAAVPDRAIVPGCRSALAIHA
jgi:hypothetical protein